MENTFTDSRKRSGRTLGIRAGRDICYWKVKQRVVHVLPHKTTRRRHLEKANRNIYKKHMDCREGKTQKECKNCWRSCSSTEVNGNCQRRGHYHWYWYRWAAKGLSVQGFFGRQSIKPFTTFRCNEVHKQNYVGMYYSVVIYKVLLHLWKSR